VHGPDYAAADDHVRRVVLQLDELYIEGLEQVGALLHELGEDLVGFGHSSSSLNGLLRLRRYVRPTARG